MQLLLGKTQLINCDGEPVTVARNQACAVYVDGKLTTPPEFTFTATGSVQPLGGRDLLLVPEGDRYKEQLWFFTASKLKMKDRVTRCGINYQVQAVEDWTAYVRARLMRIDLGPFATP